MSWVQNAFTQMGYAVLFIPETATELIMGGVAPWTCGTSGEFQKCLLRLQLDKERVYEQAAGTMNSDKVLIVCDRGALDNKVYMNEREFAQTLESLGTNEIELRDNYDAVFHLVTAAKGAEEYYTTANNSARTETVSEAAALDDKLIAAWTGHPHFRVIDNCTSFEDKMKRLIAEISSFLGEPEPFLSPLHILIVFSRHAHTGQIPLYIGKKNRNPHIGKGFGKHLQRDRLTGSRSSRYKPVPAAHGWIDINVFPVIFHSYADHIICIHGILL